jgi:hypothetical protein
LTQRDTLNSLKSKLGKKHFGGKCYLCGTGWSVRGMTIHHIWYIPNDVTYDQFPKGLKGSIDYYTQLAPLISRDSKRFRYLCNTCHQTLERFMRFGDKKFDALVRERKRTIALRKFK